MKRDKETTEGLTASEERKYGDRERQRERERERAGRKEISSGRFAKESSGRTQPVRRANALEAMGFSGKWRNVSGR